MKKNKLLLLIHLPIICFIVAALTSEATAQNFVADTFKTSTNKNVIIRPFKRPKPITNEWSIGARLNTDGYGIFLDLGKVKSENARESDRFYDIRLIQVEISEHKHAKETRSTNDYLAGIGTEKPKPFIYGKINNFYTLKLGYGYRKLIAGKPESGTVSLHWVYAGGLSVGFLKPYYVDAYVPQDSRGTLSKESIKYEDMHKQAFLTKDLIIASSGFMTGWGDVKIIPGLHAKTGLHFDFSNSKNTIIALETGINAEIYTSGIPIMANQKASAAFLNGYVSLQFGRRR